MEEWKFELYFHLNTICLKIFWNFNQNYKTTEAIYNTNQAVFIPGDVGSWLPFCMTLYVDIPALNSGEVIFRAQWWLFDTRRYYEQRDQGEK